jgi:hypothetical protein
MFGEGAKLTLLKTMGFINDVLLTLMIMQTSTKCLLFSGKQTQIFNLFVSIALV